MLSCHYSTDVMTRFLNQESTGTFTESQEPLERTCFERYPALVSVPLSSNTVSIA